MMGWLFGSNEGPTPRETINAQKKEIKGLKATIESLQRQARVAREDREDYVHYLKREHAREIESIKDEADAKVRKAELTADERVRLAKESARDEIRMMRDHFNSETGELNRSIKDVDLEVQAAELALEKKHNSEKVSLETKLARAEANVSVESQRADDAEDLAKTIVTLLNDYKAEHETVVDLIFKKIPEVKLEKFNINVEVPSPVTVNSGSGKGGDQQKKS